MAINNYLYNGDSLLFSTTELPQLFFYVGDFFLFYQFGEEGVDNIISISNVGFSQISSIMNIPISVVSTISEVSV